MIDPTEGTRRVLTAQINAEAALLKSREKVEEVYGQVWDTTELQKDFTVESFLAPFVGVVRKSDGKKGSLLFSARPRFYHSWTPE